MHLHTDLKGLRIACIRSLGFSGFFRYSELANISASHIHYEHDHVCIFIPSAKNDIYREGNYVYIKKLGNKYCPVDVLRRYTEVTNAYTEPIHQFLDLLICSNYMEQDFHTQDAEKYSKNVCKNLDTMKRNMDYTV